MFHWVIAAALIVRSTIAQISLEPSRNHPDRLDRSYQLNGPYYAQAGPSIIPVYVPSQVSVYSVTAADIGSKYGSSYEQPKSYSVEPSVDLTPSSPAPPSPSSTYGPPKTLDTPYKRPNYHYHRNHRYKSYRKPGRPYSYTHYHKGHLHTHYMPGKSFSTPASPTTTKPTFTTNFPEPSYNYHAHHSSGNSQSVRFPESHSDLTQAIIGEPGVIRNSYDHSVPFKIPQPKPNQFEVRDILKNSDLHFIDYQDTNYPVRPYTGVEVYAQQFYPGQAEIYEKRVPIPLNYQNNEIEPGSADTIKIPVAVYKGIVPTMLPMKRSDDDKTTFTPSKTNSGWIPMAGMQPQFDYFTNFQKKTGKDLELEPKKVGDIISGKIPREHTPFSSTTSSLTNKNLVGDTSNLVVSSVIKFSR